MKKIEQQYFQDMNQLNDLIELCLHPLDVINISPHNGGYILFYWWDTNKD